MRSLALVASTCAIAWVGGCEGDREGEPVGYGTTAAATGSTSEVETSSDPSMGTSTQSTSGPTDPGTTSGSGSTGSSTGPSTATTGNREPTGSTTGEPTPACVDGCAVEYACGMSIYPRVLQWESQAECEQWCEDNLIEAALFSPFCRDAWEQRSACLGTLTCEEFEGWYTQTPQFRYPCNEADTVLQFECAGQ